MCTHKYQITPFIPGLGTAVGERKHSTTFKEILSRGGALRIQCGGQLQGGSVFLHREEFERTSDDAVDAGSSGLSRWPKFFQGG